MGQRRGGAGIITSDLANLRYLARKLAKEDAKFDVTDMLDECAPGFMTHCDAAPKFFHGGLCDVVTGRENT